MTTSYIVDTACVCLYIVAPIAVIQKVKLAKLGTLRTQQNKIRQNVNTFSAENTRLSSTVETLNNQVSDLKNVSTELAAITKKTGGQTDRIVQIVRENGQIQCKLKGQLEGQVMQMVLSAVLASDTDDDYSISMEEIPRLKMRLRNIPGITLDEKNFDAMVEKCTTSEGRGKASTSAKELKLPDIMKMLHNLKDDIPEQQNIFHIDTKQLSNKNLGL